MKSSREVLILLLVVSCVAFSSRFLRSTGGTTSSGPPVQRLRLGAFEIDGVRIGMPRGAAPAATGFVRRVNVCFFEEKGVRLERYRCQPKDGPQCLEYEERASGDPDPWVCRMVGTTLTQEGRAVLAPGTSADQVFTMLGKPLRDMTDWPRHPTSRSVCHVYKVGLTPPVVDAHGRELRSATLGVNVELTGNTVWLVSLEVPWSNMRDREHE